MIDRDDYLIKSIEIEGHPDINVDLVEGFTVSKNGDGMLHIQFKNEDFLCTTRPFVIQYEKRTLRAA